MKQRIAVMLGFKRFKNAMLTIVGIELMSRLRPGNSGLAIWTLGAEPRLRSGTQYLAPETMPQKRTLCS